MKKIVIIVICLGVFMGCKPEKIDLKNLVLGEKPSIDLAKFTKDIRPQSGRFENPTKDGVRLVDKGEKIVYYYFTDNDNVTFDGAKIDPVLGAKVVTYDGVVSFISVHPYNRDGELSLKNMIKQNSTPDSIIYDETRFEKKFIATLKKDVPNMVKDISDESGSKITKYPQQIFWSKNNVLTQLIMDPSDANLNMSIKMITKKAYMDHIVEEYAKPLLKEYDSPYEHLFKK